MKRWIVRISGLGVVLAVGGFLVAASGIVPIKASSGHWPITEWFLRFSMKRSIATHSLGVTAPPLDDPALVLKGAGHYEIGCRSCHGAPDFPRPRIAARMTPLPPELSARIRDSNPEKLFYAVKHGIKFTGMPAWPSPHRDDEVWAMVAFLLKLPELDSAAYRRMVDVAPAPTALIQALEPAEGVSASVLQSCARCHGHDGLDRGNGAFPNLAGQRAEYLKNALVAYARGMRHSGIMEPVAAGLTAEATSKLARHFASLRVSRTASIEARQADAIERGKAIAMEGIPNQRVPSCIDCHGSEGKKGKPAYPLLAGQPAAYLRLQLELIKAGHRGGSAYAHLMQPVATRLTPQQMHDVALYFESLGVASVSARGR
jgi:cytochrome c553